MSNFPLYLMRHGTPALTGRMLGHTDCDVTGDGIAACEAQARELGQARLMSSDLLRARRCAEAIGTPRIDPRWRELDFGAWDGLAAADVDQDAIAAFWSDPDANPPPRGERWSALLARVDAAIADLAPAPTLVVTHGGAMRAAIASLCGVAQSATWALDLPYASVLAFTVWEGAPRRGQISGLWP